MRFSCGLWKIRQQTLVSNINCFSQIQEYIWQSFRPLSGFPTKMAPNQQTARACRKVHSTSPSNPSHLPLPLPHPIPPPPTLGYKIAFPSCVRALPVVYETFHCLGFRVQSPFAGASVKWFAVFRETWQMPLSCGICVTRDSHQCVTLQTKQGSQW